MQDCLNRVIVAVLRLPHFLNQVVENWQILLIIMQFHRAAAVNEDLLVKTNPEIRIRNTIKKFLTKCGI